MAVSTPHAHERAKATTVSRERFVMPAGYGGAWPNDQRAADVTNVVKPTQFKSPRKDPCYKRRQSKPKNRHFQRKSHWIDDVCNNNAEIHTKKLLGLTTFVTTRTRAHQNPSTTSQTTLGVRRTRLRRPRAAAGPGRASIRRTEPHISDQAPLVWRAPEGPEGLAAVPVGGGRARAGLEIDHSEPQARVWRSRGRAAAHRHTQRPGPKAAQRSARNISGAASTTGARANRPYSPPPPGSGRPV